MRSVDQPSPAPKLGNKVNKPTPVSNEPMWAPIKGSPDYMKSTDGRVKKLGCELPVNTWLGPLITASYDDHRQVWTLTEFSTQL